MSDPKRKALGRGLAALIPEPPAPVERRADPPPSRLTDSGLRTVAIEDVHPNPTQPRKSFVDARLGELAESIATQGVIQPLVVRARPAGGFELIAGERRWRAAQRAGLHEVPVVVREVSDTKLFEMALVENLQREDLNPIEEAEGYQRLINDFGYTQESLASRVGKDRTTVTNGLRLLKLPASVRQMVIEGTLSMGHARALLGLEGAAAIEKLARTIVARGLSVRQVEAIVKRDRDGTTAERPAVTNRPSAAVRDLTERLQRALNTRVKVIDEGGRGRLEIHFDSLDALDEVLKKILPG